MKGYLQVDGRTTLITEDGIPVAVRSTARDLDRAMEEGVVKGHLQVDVTCPNNTDHKKFLTAAHVMEEWLVDETGGFIEVNQCLQASISPDPGNIWTCSECGAKAEVKP